MTNKNSISDVVKTRELLVYDDSDRLRISLFAGDGTEPKIVLHKEDGSPGLQLSIFEKDSNSGRIVMFGKNGDWRLVITSTDNGSGITVYDNHGKPLGSWGVS